MKIYSAQSSPVKGMTGAVHGPQAVGSDGFSVSKGDYHDKVVLTFKEVDDGILYEVWAQDSIAFGAPAVKLGEINGTGVAGTVVEVDITEDETGDLQDEDLTAPEYVPPSNVFASDGEYETKIAITYAEGYILPGATRYYSVLAFNAAGGLSDASPYDYGYRGDERAVEEVYVCDTEDGEYALLDESEESPFEHTALAADTTKYYKLRLKSANDEYSELTDPEEGSTGGVGVTAPDAPTGVTATKGIYHGKVVVSWDKSDGATSYEIWSGTTSGGAPAKIKDVGDVDEADITIVDDALLTAPVLAAPTGASATIGAYLTLIDLEWVDGTITQGATRRFYVKAVNAGGASPVSNFSDGYRGGVIKGTEIQYSLTGQNGGYVKLTDSQSLTYRHEELPSGQEIWYRLRTETTNGLFSDESTAFRGATAAIGAGLYSAPVVGWTGPPPPHRQWALPLATLKWRQIDTKTEISILQNDYDGSLIAYSDDDGKVYSFSRKARVPVSMRLKIFAISDDRAEPVRWVYVTYRCETELLVEFYAENSPVPFKTVTIPAQRTEWTYKARLECRAQKFTIRIYGGEDVMTLLEIHRILIQYA